ncbi:MAG: hypothetical protein IPM36_04395 [Lewinellaceae bacterium]|nr:hypothetical protein [Lewinellaceae bacterium]
MPPYLADPGTRWAYYNAPYRLLHDVLEAAGGQSISNLPIRGYSTQSA